MNEIPRGWKQINDACIGVPDGKGWRYTVFHTGTYPDWRWEAWKGQDPIAMNLDTIDAACNSCRTDYRSHK